MGVPTQPVAESQLSVVHAFPSLHTLGAAVQPVAGSQLSVVQALPSLHARGALTQPTTGLHESIVHSLSSLQSGLPVPLRHVPVSQKSPTVQASLSEQSLVSSGWEIQPPDWASHASSVHALLSLQAVAPPRLQLPAALQRPTRHASRSEHSVVARRFEVTHWLAFAKLQASNLQSWSSLPKVHGDATGWQTPEPLHCPSQGLLAALGRHAAPAGAFEPRQLSPWQKRAHAALPTPVEVPQMRPFRLASPSAEIGVQATSPLVATQQTP
jgi:hypothetical protein